MSASKPKRRHYRTRREALDARTAVDASGCWRWTGYRMKAGYGKLGKHLAHRLSYEEHVGPAPEGLFVLHRCDVPACINPEHLVAGTPADNSHDMVAKGRAATAKLSSAQVAEVRRRYAAGGVTQLALAIEFGVTEESVSNIVRRRTWRPKLTTSQAA